MVASGLPMRNGDKHVSEIALLALDLRDTMAELEIPHLNNEKFRLRIGFNTGESLMLVRAYECECAGMFV